MFDSTNYGFSTEGNVVYFGFEEPADITAEMAPITEAIERNTTATGLQANYAFTDQRDSNVASLAQDLETARALLTSTAGHSTEPDAHQEVHAHRSNDDESDPVDQFVVNAVAAATAIVAAVNQHVTLTTEERRWAINLLIDEAIDVHQGLHDYERSSNPMAADRSAAAALPIALAAPDVTNNLDGIDPERLMQSTAGVNGGNGRATASMNIHRGNANPKSLPTRGMTQAVRYVSAIGPAGSFIKLRREPGLLPQELVE